MARGSSALGWLEAVAPCRVLHEKLPLPTSLADCVVGEKPISDDAFKPPAGYTGQSMGQMMMQAQQQMKMMQEKMKAQEEKGKN